MPTFDSTAVKFDSSAITWDQTAGTTPAPVFSVQPSITPTSGTVGTEFTADDGEASDTTSYTRRWLLDDVEIGTGTTVTPEAAGSLALEVTATGPGGSTVATSDPVTVSAVPTPTPSPAFRGGMGFGIGIGLSGFITMGGGGGGTPTPTPTPSVSYPEGIEAPVGLPASTGDYNDPGSPITTPAGLVTALGLASAGQTIYCSGTWTYSSGTATLLLSAIDKGTGDPVRVASADPENPLQIRGSYTGNRQAIRLDNVKGVAFVGIDIANMDAPATTSSGFTVQYLTGNCANLWWVDCLIHGNTNSDGAGVFAGLTNAAGAVLSNINLIGNTFSRLNTNIALVGVTGFQSLFNDFEFQNGDSHQFYGINGGKVYWNLVRDIRAISGVHPDFCQIATAAGSLALPSSALRAFCNFICCDPSQPRQGAAGTPSIGRCQGFLIQDESGDGSPAGSGNGVIITHSDIRLQGNINYGGEQAGIAFGKEWSAWPDIYVVDNELYHMVSPNDTISALQLRFNGPVYPANGAITGNIAHNMVTSNCTNMTGQLINNVTTPAYVKDASARDAHLAAWQEERAAFLAAL